MASSLRLVPELLAPAGGPEAGHAALQYGADAVYLGLKDFSARAEAENFTPRQLAALAAHARGLSPRRRVYVALNTLVTDHELPRALEALADAAQAGADAVILQDLGLARLAERHFPEMERHASTQMAVHNAEGAAWLARRGFRRVTLAREMTAAEVARAAAAAREAGGETEAFVHGALCYGYSGLCLASGLLHGRSGNRGRCRYPCRAWCVTEDGHAGPERPGHAFSLRDMARAEGLGALLDAGVSGLKIEGRKKSPLYVAAAVSLYRGLLDARARGLSGRALERAERDARRAADDVRSVFSRRWTTFFLGGAGQGGVADPDITGHRGAPCGAVETVRPPRAPRAPRAGGQAARGGRPPKGLVFRTGLPLERHDGLQVDLPGQAKPYGFAVADLRLAGPLGDVASFEAPVGETVWVALPADAPALPAGTPVYRASSQETRRRYPMPAPRDRGGAGAFRLDVTAFLEADAARFLVDVHTRPWPPHAGQTDATADGGGGAGGESGTIRLAISIPAETAQANNPDPVGEAGRKAFARLGGTRFHLGHWRCRNPDNLFWPPATWNRARREVAAQAEAALAAYWDGRVAAAAADGPPAEAAQRVLGGDPAGRAESVRPAWTVYVDNPGWLDGFDARDWQEVEEAIVSLAPPGRARGGVMADPARAVRGLERRLRDAGCGGAPVRVRVALPAILRAPERDEVRRRFDALRQDGWNRWLVANIWAMYLLAGDGKAFPSGMDVAADWPLYAANRSSVSWLREAGFSRHTAPLEDLGAGDGPVPEAASWVVIRQDAPLFLSAVCAHHSLARAEAGECPHRRPGGAGTGNAMCAAPPLGLRMAGGAKVAVYPLACGSAVLPANPMTLAGRLDRPRAAEQRRWRADFLWRPYTPAEVRADWRRLRQRAGGQREWKIENGEWKMES